jgi:hypothetical protein
MKPRTKKIVKIVVLSVSALVVAIGTFFVIQIGPGNIWGMIRYDQRRDGDLVVGDKAPDVVLSSLDGLTDVRLHDRTGNRPTILIFGSYT